MKRISKLVSRAFYLALILLTVNSCSIYKHSPVKDNPVNVKDRVKKNMAEGKGVKLFGGNKAAGGVFQFASSNPLWRASLDILDFAPITNASYSGGILITDWYGDDGKNESIKITIKFLSNEIRSDAIKVIVYKKNCKAFENCQATNLNGNIRDELKTAILRKASQLEKAALVKKN